MGHKRPQEKIDFPFLKIKRVRTLLRVMADDFRCQVKQIIADFKAAERIGHRTI